MWLDNVARPVCVLYDVLRIALGIVEDDVDRWVDCVVDARVVAPSIWVAGVHRWRLPVGVLAERALAD